MKGRLSTSPPRRTAATAPRESTFPHPADAERRSDGEGRSAPERPPTKAGKGGMQAGTGRRLSPPPCRATRSAAHPNLRQVFRVVLAEVQARERGRRPQIRQAPTSDPLARTPHGGT